jgi:hypothetical protein
LYLAYVGMKGFSPRNLLFMKVFAKAWPTGRGKRISTGNKVGGRQDRPPKGFLGRLALVWQGFNSGPNPFTVRSPNLQYFRKLYWLSFFRFHISEDV